MVTRKNLPSTSATLSNVKKKEAHKAIPLKTQKKVSAILEKKAVKKSLVTKKAKKQIVKIAKKVSKAQSSSKDSLEKKLKTTTKQVKKIAQKVAKSTVKKKASSVKQSPVKKTTVKKVVKSSVKKLVEKPIVESVIESVSSPDMNPSVPFASLPLESDETFSLKRLTETMMDGLAMHLGFKKKFLQWLLADKSKLTSTRLLHIDHFMRTAKIHPRLPLDAYGTTAMMMAVSHRHKGLIELLQKML